MPIRPDIDADRWTVRALAAGERDAAARVWAALERDAGAPSLACGWDWTETWLAHYGDAVSHRFLVGEAGGAPRGIALVVRAAGGRLRPRTLHVGTAGEPAGSTVFVERNGLLAAPADRAPFARALMDALERERGWDRLRLDGFLPDHAEPLLDGRASAELRSDACPVADLAAGEDVLAGLSGSRRQRIRRTLRAFGTLERDWAETVPQAHAILDELIALHQARWTASGAPGAFASARFAAFHRALVERLLPGGRAALLRVRRGDETVGCLYGLVEGERLLFYQSGLRHYDDNRLRAGVAAHVTFMEACRDRGLTRYDFLAPSARYKEELATRSEPLVWAQLERATWRTRVARARRRLRESG